MSFDIPVKFGSVTVTDGTASIGFSLDANTELGGTLLLKDPNRDQPRLFDDAGDPLPSLEAHFQLTGKVTVQLDDYSVPSECIDELIELAKRRGVLILESVSTPIQGAQVDEPEDDDEEYDEHPDVDAGRDRPVGTPAIAAAAKASRDVTNQPFDSWLEIAVGLSAKQAAALIEATGWNSADDIRGKASHDPAWQDTIGRIRGVGKVAAGKLADWLEDQEAAE